MLWRKGWMETRFRLLFAVVVVGLMTVQFSPIGWKAQYGLHAVTGGAIGLLAVALLSMMFAGTGIATQPAFQESKGLHESTLFTLSLPVSRFRLLAVRAGLGWLEMAGVIAVMCCLLWILFPTLRDTSTPEEMFRHAVVLTACATGLYATSVLLATFLDHPWCGPASAIALGALWFLFDHTPLLPASVYIFRAMRDGSPLIAHTVPWPAMAFSLGLAGILFFVALKVVQRREY